MSKHSAVYATATVAFAGMCLFAISQQGRECITGVKKWMGGTQLQKQEEESLERTAMRVAVIITVGGMLVRALYLMKSRSIVPTQITGSNSNNSIPQFSLLEGLWVVLKNSLTAQFLKRTA